MPEQKDNQRIADKLEIVLTGPDGKIKDTRLVEGKNETGKRYGIQNWLRNKGIIPRSTIR
jgi:hypothetical protein